MLKPGIALARAMDSDRDSAWMRAFYFARNEEAPNPALDEAMVPMVGIWEAAERRENLRYTRESLSPEAARAEFKRLMFLAADKYAAFRVSYKGRARKPSAAQRANAHAFVRADLAATLGWMTHPMHHFDYVVAADHVLGHVLDMIAEAHADDCATRDFEERAYGRD